MIMEKKKYKSTYSGTSVGRKGVNIMPNTIGLDDKGDVILNVDGKTLTKDDFLKESVQDLSKGKFTCDAEIAYRLILSNTGLNLAHRTLSKDGFGITDKMDVFGDDYWTKIIETNEQAIMRYERSWFVRWFLKR